MFFTITATSFGHTPPTIYLFENKNAFKSKAHHVHNTEITKALTMSDLDLNNGNKICSSFNLEMVKIFMPTKNKVPSYSGSTDRHTDRWI